MKIEIAIRDGLVAGVTAPAGVTVIGRDYDVSGSDPTDRDRDGIACFETTYIGDSSHDG